MKKVLLHCAMEKEGKQIADKLELKKKDEKTYQKDNITLIVTGIGKQLTAIEITKYIEENSKPDIIINMGYVGSTNEKIGSWVNVNKSYNYEWNIPGEQKYIIENSQHCYDSNSFWFHKLSHHLFPAPFFYLNFIIYNCLFPSS